nr:hypothetical protein [Tanacetum cinerariifolium]
MHNNIMAAGSRDRPSMLAIGRYPQWRSRFLQYIDTIPNGDALKKCILSGPYKPTTIVVQAVATTDDSLAIPEHTTVKTPMNMSPANKAHFESEKEAIHLILTGIGDEIYSTPEWSRFVMIIKQQHKLDEVSFHKLFDIMKKYQKEVNELRAERLARNANLLALVATAQVNQNPYYQTSKSQKSYAPSSKPSILSRSHTTTRYKGKEIAKPITSPSESAYEEDIDPEQAQRDKDITSSNSRNQNVDTTPWYKNDNQSGQFGNQRTMNVVMARENVGSPVVQQSGILCFNCKEFRHFAKECRKPKRVKDSTYHKEKMLLCKQAEKELEAHYSYMAKIQEVPTSDTCTDSKPLEKVQNDTGYNVFANELQYFKKSESISNTCLVEMDDSNVIPDSPDMCDDDIQNDQNDVESDDEHVTLDNLIANLKFDVDENKKIQKQLKKENTTLAQELKECKTILVKTSKTLGESNSVWDSCLVALQNKQTEFEKYKSFNDRTIDYEKLKRKLNETLGQLAQKDIEIKEGLKLKAYEISVVKEKHDKLIKQSLLTKSHYEGLVKQKTKVITDLKLKEEHDIDKMLSMEKKLKFLNEIVYKRCQSIQTIHMMEPRVPTYNGRPTFANPRYLKQAQSEIPCLYAFPYDQSTHANRLIPNGEETLALEREKKHSISLEIALQKCKEQVKNDIVWNEQASNVFRKEREQYIKIQDLKAQLQDKNTSISKLKKLIENCKGKSMETKFDKPSVLRQPNAQRIPKPSVLGKPAPFLDSLERKYFSKTKSVPKTNVSEGLSKPVTAQTLPQTSRQAVSNTNVLKPRMYQIDNKKTQTRAPQTPQTFRNTNPCVSTST